MRSNAYGPVGQRSSFCGNSDNKDPSPFFSVVIFKAMHKSLAELRSRSDFLQIRVNVSFWEN